MSYHVNPNAYGPDGRTVPDALVNRPVPVDPVRHAWVATSVFLISQATAERVADAARAGQPREGIDLDHENLWAVQGPTCLKCGADLTPDNARELCPVVLVPENGDGPGA